MQFGNPVSLTRPPVVVGASDLPAVGPAESRLAGADVGLHAGPVQAGLGAHRLAPVLNL